MEENLEARLRRLEEIVKRLEGEDLPLEEALRLYEEGVRLARSCERTLRDMRRRVEVLIRTEEGYRTIPLEEALERNRS